MCQRAKPVQGTKVTDEFPRWVMKFVPLDRGELYVGRPVSRPRMNKGRPPPPPGGRDRRARLYRQAGDLVSSGTVVVSGSPSGFAPFSTARRKSKAGRRHPCRRPRGPTGRGCRASRPVALLCLARNPLRWVRRGAWREVDPWTTRERQRSSRLYVDCSSGIFLPNGLSVPLQTQAELRSPVKAPSPTRAVQQVPAKAESGSWRRGHQSMRCPGNRHGSCSSPREAPETSKKSGS
jgi:hypothetical protein